MQWLPYSYEEMHKSAKPEEKTMFWYENFEDSFLSDKHKVEANVYIICVVE